MKIAVCSFLSKLSQFSCAQFTDIVIFTNLNQHGSVFQSKCRNPRSVCPDVKQQRNVSDSPQEPRKLLTSLPNKSDDPFVIYFAASERSDHLFRQTTLNPECNCHTSCCCVKFAASRETLALLRDVNYQWTPGNRDTKMRRIEKITSHNLFKPMLFSS